MPLMDFLSVLVITDLLYDYVSIFLIVFMLLMLYSFYKYTIKKWLCQEGGSVFLSSAS